MNRKTRNEIFQNFDFKRLRIAKKQWKIKKNIYIQDFGKFKFIKSNHIHFNCNHKHTQRKIQYWNILKTFDFENEEKR